VTALRLGLLSTAAINRQILAAARTSSSVDVVAVASRDADRAVAYAREHGIDRAAPSYEALLVDPAVDALYVSLPNSLHVEWSVRALEAGKHVLCEKPLARTAADVERAFDAAERAGRVLAEAFMYRHHPQTQLVATLVADGAIGELRALRASFSFPLAGDENVRLRPELDGGSLLDIGCYCVSGMRLLAGEPERVTAQQVLAPSGVDVSFAGTMVFPSGVLGTFHASMALPRRQGLEAFGSEATLIVEAPWRVDYGGDVLLVRDEAAERVPVPAANDYLLELDDFAAAAAGDREPLLGRTDAVGQARALEALLAAAERGEEVSV
jgi:D-xylose 1-dehydrogenase (NADP+, D-xylono-1,5-lactone-forming)